MTSVNLFRAGDLTYGDNNNSRVACFNAIYKNAYEKEGLGNLSFAEQIKELRRLGRMIGLTETEVMSFKLVDRKGRVVDNVLTENDVRRLHAAQSELENMASKDEKVVKVPGKKEVQASNTRHANKALLLKKKEQEEFARRVAEAEAYKYEKKRQEELRKRMKRNKVVAATATKDAIN
jgi:hypothetical protein